MTHAHPVLTRGGLVALAAALVLVIGLAAPAAADSQKFNFRGEAGVADWDFDDARDTSVFLLGFDGTFHNPPDQPEDAQHALMFVSQDFCDKQANEKVFRSFFGFDDLSVEIAPGLTEGTVEGGLTLHGFEFRAPDCNDPDYEEGKFTELGEFDVDVASSWEGSGNMNTSVSVFHRNEDEFTFHNTDVERSRDAEADGTLAGLDDFGVPRDLGTTGDAELASFNDSTLIIDK